MTLNLYCGATFQSIPMFLDTNLRKNKYSSHIVEQLFTFHHLQTIKLGRFVLFYFSFTEQFLSDWILFSLVFISKWYLPNVKRTSRCVWIEKKCWYFSFSILFTWFAFPFVFTIWLQWGLSTEQIISSHPQTIFYSAIYHVCSDNNFLTSSRRKS